MKCDSKFKGKLTHGLKNDIENLVNFHASCRKCRNLHFNGLLLCKVYKVTKVWKKKLTLGSKNDMRNLVNFNVRKLHVDVLLLWEVYYIWAKKSTEELCVVTLKSDAKFEEELTVCFEKWHEELGNFWPNTRESQNFHFNRDPFDLSM